MSETKTGQTWSGEGGLLYVYVISKRFKTSKMNEKSSELMNSVIDQTSTKEQENGCALARDEREIRCLFFR